MKKLCLLCMFISSFVFGGEGSGIGKITLLHIDAAGTQVRVNFSQPIKNPDNCQKTEFYMHELDDSPGSDRFLSALLAAYAAQKNVSFWIEGCTKRGYWGATRPTLHDMYMR